MPSLAAISLRADAVSSACSRLSMAQGPAMMLSGRWLPKRTAPASTTERGAVSVMDRHLACLQPDGKRLRVAARCAVTDPLPGPRAAPDSQNVIAAALMIPADRDAAPRKSAAAISPPAMRCDRFGI